MLDDPCFDGIFLVQGSQMQVVDMKKGIVIGETVAAIDGVDVVIGDL